MTSDENIGHTSTHFGRVNPEDFGIKIVYSSVALLLAIFASWFILNVLFVSTNLRFESTFRTVIVSLLLTFALPALIYRWVITRIDTMTDDILQLGNVATRGDNDRGFVLSALILSATGLYFYLYLPKAFDLGTSAIVAFNRGSPIIDVANALFLDLFTITGFGVFAGGLFAGYHRYRYPRACELLWEYARFEFR